jgi:glycosyltransferase involved in cell wall biosynthesis
VPAYNESENIKPLIAKFAEMMERSHLPAEVIIVDDGSEDQTLQFAQDEAHRHRFIRVIPHKRHLGLTAALETGFNAARGQIFTFWPADLQYYPEEIPKLIAKIDDGYDVVCGWKKGRYGLKRLVSFIYNILSRILFGVKVHDLNSVKAFRREVYDEMPTLREGWHRYLVVIAAKRGFKVGEVRVKLYPRLHGKSKFGILRIPIGLTDLFSVKYQISFMRRPLLFFGTLGFLLVLAGAIVGGVAIYFRVVLHEGYRPLLYLVMLLVMSGIAAMGLGFLAESLIYVQDEIAALRKQGQKIDRLSETIARLTRSRQTRDQSRRREPNLPGDRQQQQQQPQ